MSNPKLALTAPQTIPLDKLSVHEANVRQIEAGVSIESLAADIARRGLLQSLSVRPVLDDTGQETGRYAVQAGGRRLRALQMLVKQKRLAKNAPVPCIVRTEGFAEADSLAGTPNAKPCIRSINSAPSKPSRTKAKARKPSPPPSASRLPSSNNGYVSPRRAPFSFRPCFRPCPWPPVSRPRICRPSCFRPVSAAFMSFAITMPRAILPKIDSSRDATRRASPAIS